MSSLDSLVSLQEAWKWLYQDRLPSLARARHSAQAQWPVVLDHCFARIVLDNAIGIDRPWNEVVAAPAIRHMSAVQLQKALRLGERIADGAVDLVELNKRSLALRGKNEKVQQKKRKASGSGDKDEGGNVSRSKITKKSRREEDVISSYFLPSPQSPRAMAKHEHTSTTSLSLAQSDTETKRNWETAKENEESDDMAPQLARIRAASSLTPFRKLTLALLCQVPRGRYSTYGAMADFVSAASHKTCARAVGNAMRNNPFAPGVPCHRILAGDGSLGGFKGHWGENGKYAGDKRRLLGEEGVKFDSSGKVKGRPFKDFWLPDGLGI